MLFEIQTKTRVTEQAFKMTQPNVSFPKNLTDDILKPYGHCILNYPVTPSVDVTSKVIDDGEIEDSGTWSIKWKIIEKTIDEVQAEEDSAMINLRNTRDSLLKDSDWTQGKDIPEALSAKWAVYRALLRDFPSTIVDPTIPYEFPKAPI